MNPQWVIDLLKLSPGLIFAFGFIYLLLNPEKAEKWGSLLYKLFCFVSLSAEKRYIALNIQGQINSFQKVINKEVEGLLPYGIKIDWVGEDITPESFIAEGKLIIRLGYHKNQDENIIRIISEYISKSLIPEIKPHLSEEMRSAIDLSMAKKLLSKEAPQSALNRFYEKIYKPEIASKPKVKDFCSIIENLDSHGWFTRIFLRELKELGVSYFSRLPDEKIGKEVEDFLEFLNRIATKKPGEDVELCFNGGYLKVAIILVARAEILSIEPHKKRILEYAQSGIRSIYLAARGRNVELVKVLMEHLRTRKFLIKVYEDIYKTKYQDKNVKTICVRYIVREEEL